MRASISPIPNKAQGQVRSNIEEFPSQVPENQRLGLYEYRMLNGVGDHDGSMQPLPSSTAALEFSDSYLHHGKSSKSSPNILSAEYDPFAPFNPDMGSSYPSSLFNRRPTEMSLAPVSPSLSVVASHRSSFSSAPASETYSHPESYPLLQPPTNMGIPLEWTSDSNACLAITAPQTTCSVLANSSSSYPVSVGNTFFHGQGGAGWPEVEASPSSHASLSHAAPNETFQYEKEERKGPPSSIARTRTSRQTTKPEDANYQCKVKGCGKLFSRSYNFKAHMETHDSSRVYPFPCPLQDCSKKFVRKTDLQRHHQSVHMKERNFRCDLCSRHFARKDTLRRYVRSSIFMILTINSYRHMEDGCSKRFDIALGYNQYSGTFQEELKNTPHPTSVESPYSSTPTLYPPTTIQHSSALPATYSNAAGFRDDENAQGPLLSS